MELFQGKKYFILSTVEMFGGKNDFIWIAYMICGVMCLVISAIFWFKQKYDPENFKEYTQEEDIQSKAKAD